MTRQITRLGALLLVWVAFALRVLSLDAHSLWYDELLELDIAQRPIMGIGPGLIQHAAMPLDYYLLHGWVVLGRQDAWVRFPALFFGVLTVPLVFSLTRRMLNWETGLVAALLMAVSFFAVRYSLEARPYAMLLFFTTLAVFGLWQVWQSGRLHYWIAVAVGLVGAALSHYFAIFLLAPLSLFVAWRQLRRLTDRRAWFNSELWLLVCVLVIFVYVINGRGWHLYSVGERFAREIAQPASYTAIAEQKPNGGAGPSRSWDFFEEGVLAPLAADRPVILVLYSLLFVIGGAALFTSPALRRSALLLLIGWLVLPVVLIYLFLLHRGTFYAIRYVLYVLPAFLILVSYGFYQVIQRVWSRTQRGGWLAAALMLLVMTGGQLASLAAYYGEPPREDWRAVGQLLDNNAGPQDAVIAVKAEAAINWYYPPATVPAGTYSHSAAIWATLRQHPRRWFVLSSYSQKRDQGLRDWLESQGAVKIKVDNRVIVYYHQEGKSAAEMLADVRRFALPPIPQVYHSLAEQFDQLGDTETSGQLREQAQRLAAEKTGPG
jgi:mannosyltransferase